VILAAFFMVRRYGGVPTAGAIVGGEYAGFGALVWCHARTIAIHLPNHWPWRQHSRQRLFANVHAPPQ
jgi:hypothetical protein